MSLMKKIWKKKTNVDKRNVFGWKIWVCMKKISEVKKINIDEGDDYEEFIKKSEKWKLWMRKFVIFKFRPLNLININLNKY